MAAVIETEALTKTYGKSRGIEDVSMSVEAGEVFGFLGPNGAGKTTTIRTLLDLLHATSGSARIFGLDSHRDSLAIRARLGNLPGDFDHDPRLTGRELLAYLADLRGMKGDGRTGELAERFDADLDRPLGQLSHGNRQKIGLIQALFHDPELVVLDEPTIGLDPLMQEEFLTVVAEQRERGCTVFLSSHELAEVERCCDRVAVIREGRLVAVERLADLTGKALRHGRIEFEDPPALAEFAAIPGVGNVEPAGAGFTFTIDGDLNPLIRAVAQHRIRDLELTHPSLEEIFMTYYAGEER